MFGDANSWGAFSKPLAVIWGCVLVAIAITFGLHVLGLPIWLSVPAFGVSFVGVMFLVKPLFRKAEPTFEHSSEEQ
jgi:hypothetical protein